MNSLSEVSLTEFKEALKPETIRVWEIIYLFLAISVLLFAAIVLAVLPNQPNELTGSGILNVVGIMTWINFALLVVMIFVGKYISEKQYSKENLQNAVNKNFTDKGGRIFATTPAEKCLAIIRTSSILRLATLESSAFFGIVIILLLKTNGEGQNAPIYYINIVSVLPLLIYVISTFPTAERLLEIFQTKFQQGL